LYNYYYCYTFVTTGIFHFHCITAAVVCAFFDNAGGYLYVDDVLQQQGLQQCTEADVRRIVEENDKQRFQLDVDAESSRLKIRANQGHTVEVSKK